MHSNAAYIVGNLALSTERTCIAAPQPVGAKIVEFPSRAAQSERCLDRPAGQTTVTPVQRFARCLVTASIAAALCCAFAFTAWNVFAAEHRALDRALADTPTQTIRVQAGDSLWAIAEEHQVSGLTTQQTTDLIRSWNELDSAMLHPGMSLVVPAAE